MILDSPSPFPCTVVIAFDMFWQLHHATEAMIAKGAPFRGIKLQREDFHVLGTPTQADGGGFC